MLDVYCYCTVSGYKLFHVSAFEGGVESRFKSVLEKKDAQVPSCGEKELDDMIFNVKCHVALLNKNGKTFLFLHEVGISEGPVQKMSFVVIAENEDDKSKLKMFARTVSCDQWDNLKEKFAEVVKLEYLDSDKRLLYSEERLRDVLSLKDVNKDSLKFPEVSDKGEDFFFCVNEDIVNQTAKIHPNAICTLDGKEKIKVSPGGKKKPLTEVLIALSVIALLIGFVKMPKKSGNVHNQSSQTQLTASNQDSKKTSNDKKEKVAKQPIFYTYTFDGYNYADKELTKATVYVSINDADSSILVRFNENNCLLVGEMNLKYSKKQEIEDGIKYDIVSEGKKLSASLVVKKNEEHYMTFENVLKDSIPHNFWLPQPVDQRRVGLLR